MKSLKKIANFFLDALGVSSQRTKNIAKHVGWSTLYKAGGIVANFMLVPLTIDFLDKENYGVWLTLSSFIVWFSFLDIGLGNGLRNKFAEAKAKNNFQEARAYVSCAYYTIGIISVLLIIVSLGVNIFVDWTFVFNTSDSLQAPLKILMPIVFSFFALQLVMKLVVTVYIADQKHSVPIKIEFYTRLLSVLIIYLLTKTSESSLLLFGIIFSILPVLILLFFNFYAFSGTYKDFKPTIKLWKKKYINGITGIGAKFFLIQIAALVLYSTDNIIITNLFSPEDVVPYNVAYKYFSAFIMIYTLIVTPYWSSFTEAYTNKDFAWIKTSVKNIQKIWLIIPVGLVLMVWISDWFYNVWVGDTVQVPFYLSLSMALYVLLNTFTIIYVQFINGVGKIKIQLILSVISIIINVPLSILFVKVFGWGLSGVILATCVSLGYSVVLMPMQYSKIINRSAKGMWNE